MNKIWWKKIHNWLGIVSALFLTILLATGILLNHPALLKESAATIVAADPTNPQKLFSARADGLYVSEDSGGSWQEIQMLYAPQDVVDITFSPSDPLLVYALEKWGRVFVSRDGGKIWGVIALSFDAQQEGIELKKVSAGAGKKLVVFTSHGWLASCDDGKSWDETHLNKNSKPLYRLILTLHNGYFFGPAFVWVYDFAAMSLLVLIVSGFVLWRIGRTAV